MNTLERTGRCIICRQDNVVLSDEHIIPKSLGGVSHCYQVCKDCNSILGDHVDVGLVESPLSRLERYTKKLKGQSNTIPNPFDGTYTDDKGNKMRLELIDGKFVPHLIPEVNVDAAAGTFSVAIDVRDQKQLDSIINKVAKRNGFKLKGRGQQQIGKIDNPSISIEHQISLNEIKMGLLKIAYETTIEFLPTYYDDPKAEIISSILHDCAFDRLGEVQMSDGFYDVFKSAFASVIDFSKENRHFVFLLNIDGRLISYIKLFNLYSIAVEMSEKSYPDAGLGLVLINDLEEKKEYRFTMEELVAIAVAQTSLGLSFKESVPSSVQGFYSSLDKKNIVFDAAGRPLCVLDDLLISLPDANVSETAVIDNEFTTQYTIPSGYYLLGAPSKILLPLAAVSVTSHIKKF